MSIVFFSLAPTTSPRKSAGPLTTTSPLERKPKRLSRRPKILATVVLPVPGFPKKMRCRGTSSAFSPRLSLSQLAS
jgi:hypothetical protein